MYSIEFDNSTARSLYVQIYEYLKKEMSGGRIAPGERLPSIRNMASMLGVSVTTIRMAYDQLLVEGYLESRPQSGYYVLHGTRGEGSRSIDSSGADSLGTVSEADASDARQYLSAGAGSGAEDRAEPGAGNVKGTDIGRTVYIEPVTVTQATAERSQMMYDPDSFDFVKWKKCMASVLNDTPELLLSEGDRQGEIALRSEIASYVYGSRGVVCGPDQVVVSAGTQQLMNHVARMLKVMGIGYVCTEEPGYTPVRSIFRDWGFAMSSIPVRKDGIEIEKLPVNIRTAVYVSPQNQFPTGAVMPIGRRHSLLDWAQANDSIIIEDDYDSELRYFGMPVPALQGLDGGRRVVYIGSFTSTLFPAVRISYMVLPPDMAALYETMKPDYDQTCSKTEQLTLALFMQRGYYNTNLRHVRNLYSRKLRTALDAVREYGGDAAGSFVTAEDTQSGINIILKVNADAASGSSEALPNIDTATGNSEALPNADAASGNTVASAATHRAPRDTAACLKRCEDAASELGIKVRGIRQLSQPGELYMIFYYNQIPLEQIRDSVSDLIAALRQAV